MIKHVRLVLQVTTDEGETYEGASMAFAPKIVDIEDARVFRTIGEDMGTKLPGSAIEDLLSYTVRSLREDKSSDGGDVVDECLWRVKLAIPYRLKELSFDDLSPHW